MPLSELIPQSDAASRLKKSIGKAADITDLAGHALAARQIAIQLMQADAGVAVVTRCLSLLNDAITLRALELVQLRFRLPPARWCWLGLGSEGRIEQTLATDQDNGLLFSASDDAEAKSLRELFLPFAQAVNEALAVCGFPQCHGQVMAGNPRWCLSLAEWKNSFATWIRTPEPDALLNAAIFFDFRSVAGDAGLATELRKNLSAAASGNEIFLRMMCTNALAAQPPLGRLRDFDTSDSQGRIDLKKFGSRIFVDAARILALGLGVAESGTVARLRRSAEHKTLSDDLATASIHAFYALQEIRFRTQVGMTEEHNLIDPDTLNEFDRRVLIEALRQARALQQKLKSRFQIEG